MSTSKTWTRSELSAAGDIVVATIGANSSAKLCIREGSEALLVRRIALGYDSDRGKADPIFSTTTSSDPIQDEFAVGSRATAQAQQLPTRYQRFQIPHAPASGATADSGHPVGLRRADGEQSAAHPDLGGDGPRPLPRVVRPLPLPRPRKTPARRLPPRRHPPRLGGGKPRRS